MISLGEKSSEFEEYLWKDILGQLATFLENTDEGQCMHVLVLRSAETGRILKI